MIDKLDIHILRILCTLVSDVRPISNNSYKITGRSLTQTINSVTTKMYHCTNFQVHNQETKLVANHVLTRVAGNYLANKLIDTMPVIKV